MRKKREVLALILARGGSKGVLRKNIINIAGKPLIAWTIELARKSKHITRIVVSTDDDEIAKISMQYGAEVPFMRPKELAQDDSIDFDSFIHALNALKKNEGYECDLVVHLRPTGPARNSMHIDQAIEIIAGNDEADSLRSISIAEQNPFKMWLINKDKFIDPIIRLENNKESHSASRQSLPKAYWQNGYVDIIKPRTIFQKMSMVGDKVLPYIVNFPIYDIDYPDDIPQVELALSRCLNDDESNQPTFTNNKFPS